MTTIQEYFSKIWRPSTEKFKYSGWRLLGKVSPGESVLDVGCGYNLFKPYLENQLHGIDPYNICADEQVSIEDFVTDKKFDVIFCLGSINFGSEDVILKQVEKVCSLCKPNTRIYWRQNPGQKDHQWPECQDIDFYAWSFEKNLEFAKKFGCKVEMLAWDENRIYAEWIKL